jgi:hypothetical protein
MLEVVGPPEAADLYMGVVILRRQLSTNPNTFYMHRASHLRELYCLSHRTKRMPQILEVWFLIVVGVEVCDIFPHQS